ncbi:glycosyltransferase family 4 protein [Xanthomarina sp. F1114]|uniref:glycosyltransferase family 4 protein n=1 Tax=Xanthomarina sp. F1114 TaxID=2996019 RepID=UPI00225E2437|nr:glycosyltransferase family 4 protein [Xanthomarina sp. F1114]MCX7549068.1 glycosyltransferase family 4 protein [Xanthomarina sp. F1114]
MRKKKQHIQRIGLVLSAVPGYSETFFRNKIAGLQAQGFEVVLFVTDQSGSIPDAFGCTVISAASFKGSFWRVLIISVWTLIKAFLFTPIRSYKHVKLDVADNFTLKQSLKRLIQNAFLFSQNVTWLHFGFGMLAVGRENVAAAIAAQMAVSFRGFDLYLSPLKHPNCYKLLFKKEVRYHVLSNEMKQDLVSEGVLESAIYVITPAIDVSFFKSNTNQLTRELQSKIQLITVARLHWIKGLEYTLQAMAELKKADISFHYTIIGTGEERERLMFAAYQLDVLDQVSFAGRLEPVAVREQLKVSDIYIQYSIQEGFGNAVLEAQALGVLCVVSDADGLQENVLHEKTGWVVPKRQPKFLAAQIKELIKLTPQEKELIRGRAVTRVQRNFNLDKQQDEFVAFYEV